MDGLLSLSNDLATAVERASRSVFGVSGRARLGSTGVHWRPGLVVTADHTVHVDEEVTVTRPDGRALTATVAGRDPTIDIAVLKVDAPDVPMAEVASSIGGEVLHLDLTLYPGFSGGPLVDAQGRVVGINTSGTSRHWQLAIPAAAVNRAVDELVRRGRIPRAYLGVSTQPVRVPEALRQRLNLDQQTAVIVVEVQPGSPAAAAGLSIGDVLVSLGATRITDPTDLKAMLRPDRVGESITASVLRGGEPRDLQVTVGERPRRTK